MNKVVNGVTVECSPEEEASILATWEANEKAPAPKRTATVKDLIAALEKKNVPTEADVIAEAGVKG